MSECSEWSVVVLQKKRSKKRLKYTLNNPKLQNIPELSIEGKLRVKVSRNVKKIVVNAAIFSLRFSVNELDEHLHTTQPQSHEASRHVTSQELLLPVRPSSDSDLHLVHNLFN